MDLRFPFRMAAVPLLLALAGPDPAQAELLSEDAAVQRALNQNPSLRGAEHMARGAAAAADAAGNGWMPQLNARYLARRSDNPLDALADKLNTRSVDPATDFTAAALNQPEPTTVHATEVALTLPIYSGGRLLGERRAAGAGAEAQQLRYVRAREETEFAARQAWLSAQAAIAGERVQHEAMVAAGRHAQTTARLVREGRAVSSDRMTAELNLAAVASAHAQAVNRRHRALEQLRLVIGASADLAIELPELHIPTPEARPTPPAGARADVQAAEAGVRAAEARVTGARSVFQPQVSVVAAESWYANHAALDNRSQSVMGVVTINLFNGRRDWHGLTAAQEQAAAAEEQLMAARQRAASEARQAHSNLDEARSRLQLAADNVAKARENVAFIERRYGEARTMLIELLMAERLLVEARSELVAAALAYQIGGAEVAWATGTPLAR